jgi:phosphoglycolate phosphatase-like HAD superfamily hydrolase
LTGQVLELTGWHFGNRERLNEFILAHGKTSPGYDENKRPVATFDWDNTITKNDSGDMFTFYMINHDKILQPPNNDWSYFSPYWTPAAVAALNAACGTLSAPGEPVPASTNPACASEIYAVYLTGKTVAGAPAYTKAVVQPYAELTYMVTGQLMAGYKPNEIQDFSRAAYAEYLAAPIGTTKQVGSFTDNGWLRIYPQIKELIAVLQDQGFDVWITTASPEVVVSAVSEELAGIQAHRVIGYRNTVENGRLTPHLEGCGPFADGEDVLMNFDEGKRCFINKVIFKQPADQQLPSNPDASQRQVFAAGDSDTDIAFVKDATGLKLHINRAKIQMACNSLANYDNKWLFELMFINPRARRTTPYPCSTAKDARGDLIVNEVGQPIPDQTEPLY